MSKTGNVVTISGERYIDISTMTTAFTDAMFLETELQPMEKTLYNVQNLYPVQIWKRNFYTNAPVEGAGVTVKDASGNVASGYIVTDGVKEEKRLQDIPVKTGSDCYVTIYLKPGQTYTFEDTSTTPGSSSIR